MPGLHCDAPTRRQKLREQDALNGLDYLEVADDQRTLTLFFVNRAPDDLDKAHIRISGGRRVRDVRVLSTELCRAEADDRDDCLRVRLDKPGDFSCYTLCLVRLDERGRPTDELHPAFDPRYACLDFTFKTNCPTDLDCAVLPCPPQVPPQPVISYLAKDYASFRQLILDRLALLVPDWRERHVPDLGVALVEVLAYVGDHLSYYQDAVATEAYLDTARQRISVRRHARLVDYHMHEGCNARTWAHLRLEGVDRLSLELSGLGFITSMSDHLPAPRAILAPQDLSAIPTSAYLWFEAAEARTAQLYQAHNEICFYAWGDALCCLPKGTTSATLLDGSSASDPSDDDKPEQRKAEGGDGEREADEHDPCRGATRSLELKPGDVLVFEEVVGPNSGDPADADPSHRHAVRLIHVARSCDPLFGQPVLEVAWAEADALPFALCLSSVTDACGRITNVSVARGNILLIDHGRTLPPEYLGEVPGEETTVCGPCGQETQRKPGRFRPSLKRGPLTFRAPVQREQPASRALRQDPRLAHPALAPLVSGPPPEGASDEERATRLLAAGGLAWTPVFDLISSGARDPHVVAEMDDEGVAHLRFGDGELGRLPEPGFALAARYRVGNGSAGNAGADAITHLVTESALSGVVITPRNPLAAVGGTDPEPVQAVKLKAPFAFRDDLQRAVTPQDYAALAERDFGAAVQRAAGVLRWTGSWYEVRLAVDARGEPQADAELLERVAAGLERYRRIGHDLRALPAEAVPLELELEVCVAPHHQAGHVKAALLERFGARQLLDGSRGLFHPDALSFGEGVFLSRLVAEAKAVPGVENVVVTRLQRLGEPDDSALETGVLRLGPAEVARLDNDPSFPEHGVLSLTLRGGR